MPIYQSFPNNRRINKSLSPVSTEGWDTERVNRYIADKRAENILAVYTEELVEKSKFAGFDFPYEYERYEIYPDNSLVIYFGLLHAVMKARPNSARLNHDRAPLSLSATSDYHLEVTSDYGSWAALNDHHADAHGNPSVDFQKILLPRVSADGASLAGFHEVRSLEELGQIIRARRNRHNAAWNAYHQVEAQWQPLVEEMDAAYKAAGPLEIDNARFRAARLAVEAYDVEAKFSHFAHPTRQQPTPARVLKTRIQQAIGALRNAAAIRLNTITGQSFTWQTLLQATAYDVRGLIQIVADAVPDFEEATNIEDVDRIKRKYQGFIADWTFDMLLTARAEALTGEGERGWILYVHATTLCTVTGEARVFAPTGAGNPWQDASSHGTISPSSQNYKIAGSRKFYFRLSEQAPRGSRYSFTFTGVPVNPNSRIVSREVEIQLTEKIR